MLVIDEVTPELDPKVWENGLNIKSIMPNNIQKVIEEGLQQMDGLIYDTAYNLTDREGEVQYVHSSDFQENTKPLKDYIRTTISNVLQAIEEEVEGRKELKCWEVSEILTLLKSAGDSVK